MKIINFLALIIATLSFFYPQGVKKLRQDAIKNSQRIRKSISLYFRATAIIAYFYNIIIGFLLAIKVTKDDYPFYLTALVFTFFWISAEYFKWLFKKQSISLSN